MKKKIRLLEQSSAWSTDREKFNWDWSKRFSELQGQLQVVEVSLKNFKLDRSNEIASLQQQLQRADEKIFGLKKQLMERSEASLNRESDELFSLRNTLEILSVTLAKESAKLQQLKIQLAYE